MLAEENNLEWVERLARTLKENGMHKLEFETEDVSLTLRAAAPKAAPTPIQTNDISSADDEVEEADVAVVRSLNVGIFKPASGLVAGTEIKKGMKLGTVEAVSVEHDLVSKYTGTLVEVVTHGGDPVEYGQPLFVLSEKEG